MGYGYRNTIDEFIGDADADSVNMAYRSPKIHRRKTKKTRGLHRTKRAKKRRDAHSKRKTRRTSKRVHRTKKGQPYIILASGKARFIKRRR